MTATDPSARTAAMAKGRKADTARRRQRVIEVINATVNDGEEINVSSIARRAGVDRSFLYRHRDLLEQIHTIETQPPNTPGTGPTVSRASLQADLLNAQQRAARLAVHVQQLESRLTESLGEKAWRQSGLGAPDDIDQLKHQIVTLEQQTIDLRLQLEERDQDLAAARTANRQLMTRLNTPAGAT